MLDCIIRNARMWLNKPIESLRRHLKPRSDYHSDQNQLEFVAGEQNPELEEGWARYNPPGKADSQQRPLSLNEDKELIHSEITTTPILSSENLGTTQLKNHTRNSSDSAMFKKLAALRSSSDRKKSKSFAVNSIVKRAGENTPVVCTPVSNCGGVQNAERDKSPSSDKELVTDGEFFRVEHPTASPSPSYPGSSQSPKLPTVKFESYSIDGVLKKEKIFNEIQGKQKVTMNKTDKKVLMMDDITPHAYDEARKRHRSSRGSSGDISKHLYSSTSNSRIGRRFSDANFPDKKKSLAEYTAGRSWGYNSSHSLQQLDVYGNARKDRFRQTREFHLEAYERMHPNDKKSTKKNKDVKNHIRTYTEGMSSINVFYSSYTLSRINLLSPSQFLEGLGTPKNGNFGRNPSTFRVKPRIWLGLKNIVATGDRNRSVRNISSMKPFVGSIYSKSFLAALYEDLRDIYGKELPAKKYKEREPLNFTYAPLYSQTVSLYKFIGVHSLNACCISGSNLVKEIVPEPIYSLKSDLRHDRSIGSIGAGFGDIWVARNMSTKLHYLAKVYDKLRLSHLDDQTKRKAVESITEERGILEGMGNPFLLSALAVYQDDRHLYIVLDYRGGETLDQMLFRIGRLSEGAADFFIAEIIQAIGYLHRHDIVYRALSPEMVTITKDGHVQLTDFSACKGGVTDALTGCTTICGRDPYSAPEVMYVGCEGYGKASDWWAVGIIHYKMLIGKVPVPTTLIPDLEEEMEFIFDAMPSYISNSVVECLKGLLCLDPSARLGATSKGTDEIKAHPMFSHLDWNIIENQGYCSPYEPPENHDFKSEFFPYGAGYLGEQDMFYPHTPQLPVYD